MALDLYRVKPLVFRKLPDLGIATRVKISPTAWSVKIEQQMFDQDIEQDLGIQKLPFCCVPGTGTGGARLVLWLFFFRSSVEV